MATFAQPTGYQLFRSAEAAKIVIPAPNKFIDGYVIRGRWSVAQPKKNGPFDFTRERAAIDKLTAQGKSYQLEIFAGVHAPDWTGGVNAQFLPAFRQAYEKLADAMGKAFGGDKNLTAVHCCLPMNTSPEFRLDGTSLVKTGWVNDALNANGLGLIALAKAFPRCVIVANLHNPSGNASDGFVAQQIEQGKRLLGKQFAVQENAFNSKPAQRDYNLYQLVQQHAADGYPAGYEQVWDSSNTTRYGTGGFVNSLGYLGKAQWLIVYEKDVPNIRKPWGQR